MSKPARRPDKSHTVGLDSLRPNETRMLAGVCPDCNSILYGALPHLGHREPRTTFYLRLEALELVE